MLIEQPGIWFHSSMQWWSDFRRESSPHHLHILYVMFCPLKSCHTQQFYVRTGQNFTNPCNCAFMCMNWHLQGKGRHPSQRWSQQHPIRWKARGSKIPFQGFLWNGGNLIHTKCMQYFNVPKLRFKSKRQRWQKTLEMPTWPPLQFHHLRWHFTKKRGQYQVLTLGHHELRECFSSQQCAWGVRPGWLHLLAQTASGCFSWLICTPKTIMMITLEFIS